MTSPRKDPWRTSMACVLALSLSACSTGRSRNEWHDLGTHQSPDMAKVSPPSQRWGKEAEPAGVSDPIVAPGYLLSLRNQDDNKLNGEFRVDLDGSLVLPYNVTLNTNGMSLSQLEKRLNEAYRPYFKTSSGVKVRVQERRYWLDVRGSVEKPGRYLVEQNASLDQVISLGGGLDKENTPRFVRIQKGSKSILLDLTQYLNRIEDHPQIAAWLGGEIVFFQKDAFTATPTSAYRLPVYIMGQVRKPGEYTAKPGTDFVDLVTQAQGFTEMADLKRIEVIRRTGGRQYAYEFEWNDFERAPTLSEGDVVFVHADAPTRTERRLTIGAIVLSSLATIVTAWVLVDSLE